MLRCCFLQLAKKKGAAPRRHVVRRPLRRASSTGGSGAGSISARRTGSSNSRAATCTLAKVKTLPNGSSSSATPNGGKGIEGRTGKPNDSAMAAEDSIGGSDAPLVGHGAAATVSGESGVMPLSSARRPLYRLATAVATVVVPPTTNVYLEGMKHILSPAAASQSGAARGTAAASPVSILEEYYTSKKGPLFATAVVAGTNAVKQVSSLVPFCYPSPIQRCSFTFRRRQVLSAPRPAQMPHRVVLRRRTSTPGPQSGRPEYSVLYCFCTVATENKAGVEMEALTGATMASVTLYDMLKGIPGAQEDGLSIGEAFVLAKRGGRNDFTKLLMSEPEHPLVEKSLQSVGGGEVRSLPLSAGIAGNDAERATVAAHREDTRRTDGFVENANMRATDDGQRTTNDNENEKEDPEEEVGMDENERLRPRMTRRPASPSETAAVDGNDPSTPGDTGAWWRSSKQEKRLQELYPRRKYGDNSRLTHPAPLPQNAVASATRDKEASPSMEEGTAERRGGTAAAADAVAALTPTGRSKLPSKASMIRDGVATTLSKSAALRSEAAAAGAAAAALSAIGDDREDEMEHRRSPNRSRLAKKAARAPVPVEEEEAEEGDDGEEPHLDTSNNVDVEEEEEAAVEEPTVLKKRKQVNSVSAPKLIAKSGRKKGQASSKRTTAEIEEEEEEEEAKDIESKSTPTKSPAVLRRTTSNSVAVKRGDRGAPVPMSRHATAPPASRKHRAGRVVHKKTRESATDVEVDAADYDDEDGENRKGERSDNEEDEGENDEEAEEVLEELEEPPKRRSRPSTPPSPSKSSRGASVSRPPAMHPVRHDSWDEGSSRRSRHSEDRLVGEVDDDFEQDEAEVPDEDSQEDHLDEEIPPPPRRKKVQKTVKRTASVTSSKRR